MEIRLALTGFGNVGQGLATLLQRHSSQYEQRYGVNLLLVGVADRAGAAVNRAGLDPAALLAAKEDTGTVVSCDEGVAALAGDRFLDHAGAQILVEAASTNFLDAEPGWSYVRSALARGMDVVMASKGSLAVHWSELQSLARQANRQALFSATVGAPMPSLQIAERGLVGATINGFEGILNSTSHQVLSAMSDGASYEEGVCQAQAMGIAETDPTLDVDGWDAAAKVLILANAMLGANLRLTDVARTGIRQVTAEELARARRDGEAIKLIGRAMRTDQGVRASVAPERRSIQDALGRLRGDDMGIIFLTEPLGKMAVTVESAGQGGGIVTAMTVLRDIFNLARDRGWMAPSPQ